MLGRKSKAGNGVVFKMLKKCVAGVCACALALSGIMMPAPSADAAQKPEILFPADRGVFQRNADNVADITVNASYDGTDILKAGIEKDGETVVDWVLMLPREKDGEEGEEEVYCATLESVPAGGWYQVVVASFDAAGGETSRTEVEHIGVGEVFITGGQSNSASMGGEKTQCESDYVSAYVPGTDKWQHCEDSQPSTSDFYSFNGGGSPWPTLGDELNERLGVPIGFIASGRGSAMISELADTSDSGMYKYIKTAIEKIRPYGCRAFIMHQGEADADSSPDTPDSLNEEYLKNLNTLIEQTRNDMGYDLNWFVAQVSYAWSGYNKTIKMENMKATQRAACNNYNIFVGPTTDDMQGEYRYTDNLHFSKLGLVEHGKRWADVIMGKLFTGYKLRADSVVNGKIEQCGPDMYAGNVVKLTAVPDEGYCLVPGSFNVTGAEGEIPLTDDSFIMRAEDLSVSCEFAQLPAYFGKLLEAIRKAEAVNGADYEAAGIDALKAAVEKARAVYSDSSSTEAETEKALLGITAAMNALVKKNADAAPSASPAPAAVNTPAASEAPEASDDSKKKLPSVGSVVKYGNIKYVVMLSSGSYKTVSVAGLVNKKKTSVTIPKSIKIEGHTYNVTGISKNAFKGASKLSKITIKSTMLSIIGKNAFAKVSSRVRIKVPAGRLALYRKLIRNSGFKKISAVKK